MGMFLTKYGMLNLLSENKSEKINKGEWWHKEQFDETQKILSKYKIIGFVIHDPQFHFDFDKKFNEIFEKLDFITGHQFLFFGLINPSTKFKKIANGREYFGVGEKDMLLNPGNSYETDDSSISTYSLVNILDIEYDDLPVIVLTDDLNKKKFSIIKTCNEHLEKQLSEVGFFCEQNKNENIQDKIPNLLETINLCNGFYENQLNYSLANALSDFLSFIVKSDPKSHDIKIAKQQSLKVINSIIYDKINVPFDNVERLNLFLTGALIIEKPSLPDIKIINRIKTSEIKQNNIEYCEREPSNSNLESSYERPFSLNLENSSERESLIISQTFNNLYPVYSNIIEQSIKEDLEVDYTPIAFCLCKIFEIETNLSLVQWIRKELEIEMPLYYKKHKKDNKLYTVTPSAEIISNPKPIDFNQGRNEKWIAPGIGQSELVIQSYLLKQNLPTEIKDYEELLKCWSTIRQIRNRAAHTELINEQGFKKLTSAFTRLNKYHLLSQYNVLKNSLKNKKPLQ